MTSVEEIGEAAIRFFSKVFSKVFYYLIGVLIRIIEEWRKINKRVALTEKINLYKFFGKRGVDLKDYIILKIQASTLAFLIFSVLFIFGFIGTEVVIILLVSGLYSVYATFSLKEHFARDFKAYRDFFFSYLGISIFLIVVKAVKPTVSIVFPLFHLFLISILSVLLVSYEFKRRYGREYTFGKVLEAKDGVLKVKVNYDICSSVKPGVYSFKDEGRAKIGDEVKLKTERGFFNLKGSKVVGILY